jgi:hypothetical protein
MRLLVCGDREWSDYIMIEREIKNLKPAIVIEGEARGADSLARKAAETLGIPVLPFPADWDQYGRSAGPIRNRLMLSKGMPTLVLAFHDNLAKSKGTLDMVNAARKYGVEVRVIGHGSTVTYPATGRLDL